MQAHETILPLVEILARWVTLQGVGPTFQLSEPTAYSLQSFVRAYPLPLLEWLVKDNYR